MNPQAPQRAARERRNVGRVMCEGHTSQRNCVSTRTQKVSCRSLVSARRQRQQHRSLQTACASRVRAPKQRNPMGVALRRTAWKASRRNTRPLDRSGQTRGSIRNEATAQQCLQGMASESTRRANTAIPRRRYFARPGRAVVPRAARASTGWRACRSDQRSTKLYMGAPTSLESALLERARKARDDAGVRAVASSRIRARSRDSSGRSRQITSVENPLRLRRGTFRVASNILRDAPLPTAWSGPSRKVSCRHVRRDNPKSPRNLGA